MTPRTSIARLADCAPVASPDSWPARKAPSLHRHGHVPDQLDEHVQDFYNVPPSGDAISGSSRIDAWTGEHRQSPSSKLGFPATTFVSAHDAAYAALEAQAALTIRRVVKDRARAYALRPRDLDAIAEGLSELSPWRLVQRLTNPLWVPGAYRWLGFGGEVQAINLRGAMLYARYSRAKKRQIARRTA
jgi:hypothetical protein